MRTQLKEFMNTKEKVVVMGHRLPDADSFGAAIGIYRAAKTLNKKAYIVIDNPTSSIIPLMNTFRDNQDYEADMFVNNHEAKEIMDDNTLLVVVDTNKPSITQCEDLLYMAKMIVVLDHHRQGSDTIRNSVLSYIEPYASSASEMVAEILQYFTEGIRIRNVEADSIYAGIMIDTDNFMQKTGVRTFEAAAFLRRCGADVTRVRKLFREDMNELQGKRRDDPQCGAVPRPVRDFRMPERLCGQPDGGRSTSGERAAEHCRCQGVLCTDRV